MPPPAEGADAELIPDAAASTVDEMTSESATRLEELQAELESVNDRYLRLAAEFDNFRKRIDRERAELRTRAQADLVAQLLEVLDDLQRVAGFSAGSTNVESLLEGVGLVEKKFRHVLESQGLEPINAEGEFFNPAVMEALMTVAVDRPEEDDMVADVFQKGYRFREVLIRPARVRVKKFEG
jgi:molecular chaperone GrpE